MLNKNSISFIVIGRNEGWKLEKCFKSIFETIEYNILKEFEVIYVDSDSTDDSIARAKKFPSIKIFKITSDCNAAIGRNIGANESTGDVLFFIDGDMEIISDFIPLVFNEKRGLFYDFVSGQFLDYYYNYDGKLLYKNELFFGENDKTEFTTGGLFLIKKDLWDKVGGMNNNLRRSQDIDLAIRLTKHSVFLLRKKEQLAIHHTISYLNNKRTWKMLLDGSLLFRSVLMRNNFFNRYQWRLFLRENYTSIFLLIAVLTYLVTGSNLFLVIYLIMIITRILQKKIMVLQKLNLFVYFLFRDIATWFALFFFWPSTPKKTIYTRIIK